MGCRVVLGLRMERRAADMAHALGLDIVGQFVRDVTGAIVTRQPGFVLDRRIAEPETANAMSNVLVTSSARIVLHSLQAIMYREKSSSTPGQVHPAPVNDFEVGKIGLPHLVGPDDLGVKLVCRFDYDCMPAKIGAHCDCLRRQRLWRSKRYACPNRGRGG
jgi:hypothetical protein